MEKTSRWTVRKGRVWKEDVEDNGQKQIKKRGRKIKKEVNRKCRVFR